MAVGTPSRLLGRTLRRSVAREAAIPTAIALAGLTVVVLTKDLLGLSDLIINRGFGVPEVLWILFLRAIPFVALMLPFAVLVGSLVALGRLGADREILALESLGVPASRLVQPVALFAAAMALAGVGLHTAAAPWASRSLNEALVRFAQERPWAQIRAGHVQRFAGWALEVREASPRGDELEGVLLFVPEVGETIFARGGELETGPDGRVTVVLHEGAVLLSGRGGPRQIRFERMATELPKVGEPVDLPLEERLAGLSLPELVERARARGTEGDDALDRATLALHRRFALPVATLIFGVLAVPLFLRRRTWSRSGGGVLGLAATLAYYGLAQLGEGLAQGDVVGSALGAWLPDLALAALAAVLLLGMRGDRRLGEATRGSWRDRRPREARAGRGPRRFALARYVAARFVGLSLLAFSVLLVGYFIIDVMERLEWFARHGAGGLEIVRFYGARIPLLASRVVPMSLLVGTALTVSLLAAEGELVGIRSCGLAAPRALLPVLAIALLVTPSYFLLTNEVLPRTNALADRLKETEIKEEHYSQVHAERTRRVWYREGSRIVEAERLDPDRGDAERITIYEMGPRGLPVGRTDARGARHVGNGVWRLEEPVRLEVHDGRVERVAPPEFAELGQAVPSDVDTMHLPVGELSREIEEVRASGYDATRLRVDLHVKLAAPLACLLLPAVVLFFALTGPPYPGPAQTLLVAGILGVGFILLTGVSASLGYGGTFSAAAGGWTPVGAYGALAGWLGVRVWRHS